ncbi:MAG: sulfatase-like hydrolase/transferase [Acidobacteriota bacterium]|nr:sulfatase-like hydrolase/transferase [Acidobacteriota bacterium]
MARSTRSPTAPGSGLAAAGRPGHAVVLTALAVATPLCDLLRRFPEFLWAHGLSPGGIAALVAALVLLPPLPPALLLVAARRAGRAGPALAGLAIAAPLSLLALQAAVRAGAGGWPTVVAAAVLAALGAAAYLRWRAVRAFTTLLALVALVAPLQLLAAAAERRLAGQAVEVPAPRLETAAPVVFVIFDELPMVSLLADGERWDGRNFPSFRRLAATSHAFLNLESVDAGTLVAVPAILTGSLPAARVPPTRANFPRNLFTLFAASHELAVVEQATELCPEDRNRLRPAAPAAGTALRALAADLGVLLRTVSTPLPWAAELPPVDVAWRDFGGAAAPAAGAGKREEGVGERYQRLRSAARSPASDRAAEFRRFVASLEPARGTSPAPTLHYLHTMLPHGPWLYDPAGKAYTTPERSRAAGRGETWSREASEMVALGYQRHLLQARFADRLLGELLDRLAATGRFDASLVVVTADHGASFRPGEPPRDGSGANPAETLWVPLLIKAPGQTRGAVHRMPLTSVDVLPTVLDLLGAEAPWPVAGKAALRAPDGAARLPDASAARAWKASLFGDDLDFEPPLATNRHAALLGRLVSTLPVSPARGLELRRLEPGARLDYDPTGRDVPLLIAGTLRRGAGQAECCDLAFAVNGRIAAVQHTYPGSRARFLRFQALLAESSLAPGANELAIYAIEESPRGPRLSSLTAP